MSSRTTRATTDAVEILKKELIDGRPEMQDLMYAVEAEADVARKVHALRTEAGLTREQLAQRAGTTLQVIEQLEQADFDGHWLGLLNRIAAAVGKRVEINLVSVERS